MPLLSPTRMETTNHERDRTGNSTGAQMKSLRMFRILFFAFTVLWSAGFAMAVIDRAQQIPESLYSEMKWRMIGPFRDRKSTRLNSSHVSISYAGFCLKKKSIP